jgi:hypothetical protein
VKDYQNQTNYEKFIIFRCSCCSFLPQLSQGSHEARITVEVAHCPQHLIRAILGRYMYNYYKNDKNFNFLKDYLELVAEITGPVTSHNRQHTEKLLF